MPLPIKAPLLKHGCALRVVENLVGLVFMEFVSRKGSIYRDRLMKLLFFGNTPQGHWIGLLGELARGASWATLSVNCLTAGF